MNVVSHGWRLVLLSTKLPKIITPIGGKQQRSSLPVLHKNLNKDKVAKSRDNQRKKQFHLQRLYIHIVYICIYIYTHIYTYTHIYIYIHSFVCTWSQRRNYFSEPRIEGEKTLGTYEQADELNGNYGYICSQKQEKWSLGKKSFIRNTDARGEWNSIWEKQRC